MNGLVVGILLSQIGYVLYERRKSFLPKLPCLSVFFGRGSGIPALLDSIGCSSQNGKYAGSMNCALLEDCERGEGLRVSEFMYS